MKQCLEHEQNSDKLQAVVSVALRIPSSLQREMASSALIYNFTANSRVRRLGRRDWLIGKQK